MAKTLRTLLLLVVLLPTLAAAQVTLGLRAGFGLPAGDLQKNSKLKDQIKSLVPIQLDAMFRLTPQASVGAYASYGFGQVASALKDSSAMLVGPGASSSASIARVGLQGTWTFPVGEVLPWVGLGSGLEVGSFEVKNGAAKITGTTRGWEYANLQAGADYALTRSFAAGLYAMWSVGKYTYQGGKVSGTPFDGEAGGGLGSDAATHSWLSFGLRGKFDL